jgi:hypothetical protein
VDRSLRQLGQLLVVMGALLGAVLGVALALVVENIDSPRPVAVAGSERAAVLGAHPPNSQPPASGAARSRGQTDGSGSSGSQRVESADRANQGRGTADKQGEGPRDKAEGRGTNRSNNSKSKNK